MRLKRPQVQHVPALEELEDLADSAVSIAEQIRAQVAELRRQDTRGDTDEHRTR